MDKYIGKVLDGRYQVVELLGVGGMSLVYKGTDLATQRTVAIKIMKDEFAGDNEFKRRFVNESRAIAKLSHVNIVNVYDVHFGEDIQYIVMEYIHGITLKDYINQQGKLPWKEAVYFVVQILRALQHAHDQGIVHRDIKPQNIMLLEDGTIKITDFGIAKFVGSQTQTVTDKAIGSVHYISPEQASGGVTDEKSDVYSVGVMLYEMLTGKVPFDAENPMSILMMHLSAKIPSPKELNPAIPDGLEEIIVKAMQKNTAQRYQCAAEMLRDIDEFKRNPSIRFEYKYFSENDQTKYVNAINAAKPPVLPDEEEDGVYETDEYDYEGDEEYEEDSKKKKVVPIVTGIAAAAVLLIVVIGVILFVKNPDMFGKKEVEKIPAPNLVGLKYEDVIADPQYTDQVEIVLSETKPSDQYEDGFILEQDPIANTEIAKGSKIKVVVSGGEEAIEIPDFGTGTTYENAEKQLIALGVKHRRVDKYDEDVAEGYVISTDPAAGSKITKDQEVLVYVSQGQEVKTEAIPNLLGMDRSTAVDTLTGLGMIPSVSERASSETKGKVIEQSIAEGTKVERGTQIDIVVSTGEAAKKQITAQVSLPQDGEKESVTVRVEQNGSVVYQQPHQVSEGTINIPITGTGPDQIDIYIDDQLAYSWQENYSSGVEVR